ncbi:ABC transporter family protein [Nocardia tenerifensis]|uniref:ABC transporter family protein n=1 Tax=Nocardia tenerifensis TaxID=228006 RepID=A0A318KEE3_9NOCA|nr:ABC transporter family protein [Nocardia tenerifensis]
MGVDVVAANLAARGSAGCAFENVYFEIPAGGLAAVVGSAGSGRTSLLWALAGRLRLVTGRLAVGGHRHEDEAGAIRDLVAVARLEPGCALDPWLRVGEVIEERALIGGPRFSESTLAAAFDALGIAAPAEAVLVGDLAQSEQSLLAVALAAAQRPGAVVVDDIGAGCTDDEARWVWERLRALSEQGCTVIAAASSPPLDDVTVITLAHPRDADAPARDRADLQENV